MRWLAAALVAGSAVAANAADPARPEAFLRHLYAPYVAGNAHVDPTGDAAPRIFDARLTALIRRDRANAKGEVGALDGDPICDCQDFGRFKALAIRVTSQTARRAIASVRFTSLGARQTLTYSLTKTATGWRVSDIASPDMPSLVGLLTGPEH